MPRAKKAIERTPIRIPAPLIQEVDKIIAEMPGIYANRQQFIENAIREKLERAWYVRLRERLA